jgi:hypothetical protein
MPPEFASVLGAGFHWFDGECWFKSMSQFPQVNLRGGRVHFDELRAAPLGMVFWRGVLQSGPVISLYQPLEKLMREIYECGREQGLSDAPARPRPHNLMDPADFADLKRILSEATPQDAAKLLQASGLLVPGLKYMGVLPRNDAAAQSIDLYAVQAEAIRELLDRHAPDTAGNLQTRLEQVLNAGDRGLVRGVAG